MGSPYQVPKYTVPVQVFVPALGTERVQLYLADRAESHEGRERPSDLVNGSRDFLVAQDKSGQTIFLHRDAVAVIAVRAEHELGSDASEAAALTQDLDTSVRLAVTLDNGTRLEGEARYQLPKYRSRVQDFLNKEERFLALLQGGVMLLIHKRHIARVVPL